MAFKLIKQSTWEFRNKKSTFELSNNTLKADLITSMSINIFCISYGCCDVLRERLRRTFIFTLSRTNLRAAFVYFVNSKLVSPWNGSGLIESGISSI